MSHDITCVCFDSHPMDQLCKLFTCRKNAIETGDDRLEIFLKTLHDAPLKL